MTVHRASTDARITAAALAMWLATVLGERWSIPGRCRVPVVFTSVLVVAAMTWRGRMNRTLVSVTLVVVGVVGGSWAWHVGSAIVVGHCEGIAVLRTDPSPLGHGVSVVLEMGGVRRKALAFGPPSWRLETRLAGERVWVSGDCAPLSGNYVRRDKVAHIAGRLAVQSVSEQFDEGSALVRSVNRLRRTMARGISLMPDGLRGLFTGLVIGDDRGQSRSMVDDFRASGLSHLCAVSGQNVAYLLVVASPFMRGLRRVMRWWVTVALLVWFVLLTRAEPSVLRAAFMAGAVVTTNTIGWRVNARAVLAFTVVGLLVIDPMLAWSVGFALSVGATAGLAWFSSGITRLVGGRGVLAATLSAQLGTMPVSLWVFGHVSVVSLIANPLTVATAGVVMMAGLPCALVASVHPALIRVVSSVWAVPVGWIAGVAHVSASVAPHGVVNVVGWCVVAAWLGDRWRRQRRCGTDVAG